MVPPLPPSNRPPGSGLGPESHGDPSGPVPTPGPPPYSERSPGEGPGSAGSASRRGGLPLAPTELHALLGAGTSFRGTISFAGRVRIDGSFEGEIHGGELLVVGDGAEIRGQVNVDAVIVQGGRVEADITARRSIELYVPAQVTGALHSPEIFLDKGVQFSGQCDMSPVDEDH